MKLSIEQEKAVNHYKGPALVLAVPGAGKTTVLLYRTINLIEKYNIRPEGILSITFSKSSALDMKERFNNNFPQINSSLTHFSTIHAFCYGLIREYAYINKLKYILIEDNKNPNNKYNLLKRIYLEVNKDYITEEKLDNLLNAIGYIKNMMLTTDEYLNTNKIDINNFKTIYNTYENYKRTNNLLDFDDMLTISLEILENDKYLLQKYRNKYDFIQVDEGQDTSKAQMKIIYSLAYPKNNIFIVADDDQSIYSFRGSNPKGLFEFNKNFTNCKLFFMEHNYRSSKNIVSISNKLIQNNTVRYKKNIFTDNNFLEPISLIKVQSILDQYNYIIEDIKDKNLMKCCILYRNNISSIGLIDTLEKNNIPFYMRDTNLRFFNHWIVQDMINLMIFSKDTSNLNLYESFYYKMKGYISKLQLNYAKSINNNKCVFDRIMNYPNISEFYKKTLRELKMDFKLISKLKPRDAIKYIEHNLEYDNYLKEQSMKSGNNYESLTSILFYLKLIADQSEDLDHMIQRLKHLQYLYKNSKHNTNGITLSTVHSIKGLEFDRVYIIDLMDGEFPNQSSIDNLNKGDNDLLEEERRLFYVGMTRAKDHLSLITLKSIGTKLLTPSRFLVELQNNNIS